MKKYVYLFSEADGSNKALFGGKGANLAEMTKLGMPVPQGFTITTEACTKYYNDGEVLADEVVEQIFDALAKVEKLQGKKFGDLDNPYLVSVRSGARASMPGMMDTILNLGLNDVSVQGLAKLTGDDRFAYDCYRRFIQMYSDVVIGVGKQAFERMIGELKDSKGYKSDVEMTASDLQDLINKFKAYFKADQGYDFPQDPKEQLIGAVKAVFRSWDNPRAIVYRRMNDIPGDWGTAVNVQSMVFGNMGETSGTGVAFTRNPSTGEKKLFGEYLMNAQGEDVVAGVRTPSPIDDLAKQNPEAYAQFVKIAETLEKHNKDMQDMEFTIERGKLFMLQTRNGKRTATAALQIAVDLVKEGMISEEEACLRVEPKQLDTLLHPQFDPAALKKAVPVAKALPASPGAACGKICFTAEEAVERNKAGEKVVLVRLETSPEDIEGMVAAEGILTARGGMTSHAAVVARGMGECCVAGCGALLIDEEKRTVTIDGKVYTADDYLSLDGSTGNVYAGQMATMPAAVTGNFATLMGWADKFRALKVRTNADTPKDAKQAYDFGAEGIGLCRTEHMFFKDDRIMSVRKMIVAKTVEARKAALNELLPMQREDFVGIYEAMKGYGVTIRFLDPPLHEFVPHKDSEIQELADELKMPFADLKKIVDDLHEFNPMLGHRGCRLSVTYPEIAEMQARAVMEAAIIVSKRNDFKVTPEIMIPLVGEVKELKYVKEHVVATLEAVMKEQNYKLDYKIGTMIEIPRAALTADEIAKEADFFSFGTNDLTQMTFGFSRDDAGKFLDDYYAKKIFESDPFAKVDQIGVGRLMKIAATEGRAVNPDLHLGICGEHGGDPSTVEFCHNIGLDYVSCSPFRVPLARLAAAQANIRNPRG
ncbi:MAG: pyruvate, phosphate dikinase [Clostridia bacterium]|nr:pyruvate, phosphate dikinase [Clostridia bacterium]MDY5264596.1 pyruvate, phosphate dikinase [Eubacteriales bacterium]MDY5439476.1 pyruvate, phosphate dikinase [Eubacteriales bacterium]